MNTAWILARAFLALALLAPLGGVTGASLPSAQSPDAWVGVDTGIQFQLFHLFNPRPMNIFVARLERGNSQVTLDSAIAQGKLYEGRETVRGMASRSNQAINYWGQTWGNRNRVAVAINGYFFNLNSGTPMSGQVQSGWYAQRFDDFVGNNGFAWGLNRSAFIGDCVYHTPADQFITYLKSGKTQKVHGLNQPRGDDQLVLYTPQYDVKTHTDASGIEILVEMSRPALILPGPAMAKGTVVEIRDRRGSTSMPFDHVVLSGSGLIRDKLLENIRIGDEIGISQEITDCAGSTPKYWTKTYASIGGDYHFLNGGVIRTDFDNNDSAVPNSRTAIAYNQDYVFFIVVDGWNLGVSEGIKILELANFAKYTLMASDGVSLDSGGSSTMVINGVVVNNTYCNFTRNCGMQPEGEKTLDRQGKASSTTSKDHLNLENSPDLLEPLVGNAMLMVVVEPVLHSTVLRPTQPVLTTSPAALRLGPGTNYAILSIVPANSQGVVLTPFYHDLNGVFARGSYWWKVAFANLTGWMAEESLQANGDPLVELWASNDSPTMLGEITTLQAQVSNGEGVVFSWDLGDGAFATGSTVTHNYLQQNVYDARVTALVNAFVLRASTRVIVSNALFGFEIFLPLVNR